LWWRYFKNKEKRITQKWILQSSVSIRQKDGSDELKAKNYDYHWYLQLPNGKWVHKPGKLRATKLDYSPKRLIIYDLETCNRHYPGDVNYSVFLGFIRLKHQ
jgi:hypothetical protein